jgi:hypothetical protein
MDKLTPFEQQMAQFFPEIFSLHMLAKDPMNGGGGEEHIWELVQELLEMHRTGNSGNIYVSYSRGRIDKINVTRSVLSHTSKKIRNASDLDNS